MSPLVSSQLAAISAIPHTTTVSAKQRFIYVRVDLASEFSVADVFGKRVIHRHEILFFQ